MIRLFEEDLAECALHARTTRGDKPNFARGGEQTCNPRRFQGSLVLSK
jgi:hypothetical protein